MTKINRRKNVCQVKEIETLATCTTLLLSAKINFEEFFRENALILVLLLSLLFFSSTAFYTYFCEQENDEDEEHKQNICNM